MSAQPTAPARPIVIGTPPTEDDQFWLDVFSKDTPAQALTRLDTYGKYLFSLTATIGTVLTGFSLFKADSLVTGGTLWLLLPALCFAVGLGFASLGLRPRPALVNRHDPAAIRTHYNAIITASGRWLSAAGIAFAVGLFMVPLALLRASPGPEASTSITFERAADQSDTITAKFDVVRAPAGASAKVAIEGVPKGGTGITPFAAQVGSADTTGKVSLQTAAKAVKGMDRYRIEGIVMHAGTVVLRRQATIP